MERCYRRSHVPLYLPYQRRRRFGPRRAKEKRQTARGTVERGRSIVAAQGVNFVPAMLICTGSKFEMYAATIDSSQVINSNCTHTHDLSLLPFESGECIRRDVIIHK